MPTSSVILESYQLTFSNDVKNHSRYEEGARQLLNANKNANLLTPLTYYLRILKKTNPVTFLFMDDSQKEEVLTQLQITYFLLLAQTETEKNYGKSEHLKAYAKKIQRCQQLIDSLLCDTVCQEKNTLNTPEKTLMSDGHPVAYLALALGQWVGQRMVEVASRKTKTIKDGMGWFNEKRLYWVWGSSLLKTMLELMPHDFFNSDQAKQAVRLPDPYTGCLSWGLYYFRFSLNLCLLLKHTIKGPWMEAEEAQHNIPWTERFLTQWDQRKFTLLNDSVWATGNILCFFILTGKGVLGTWGDALTLGLLVFDVSLALWEFAEEQSNHEKELLDFETSIAALQDKQKQLRNDKDAGERYAAKMLGLDRQLAAIKKAQAQCIQQWQFKKLGLINSTAYAIGLMLAFMLLTMPFLPIAAPAMLIIGTAGAVLCFALSVLNNAIRGGLEIYKAYGANKEASQEYLESIKQFEALLSLNPAADNEKKLLYLEIKRLKLGGEYQQGMILLQTMHLARSIMFETVVPALIFTSLVFFPLGIGFAMIGGILALALGTNIIINQLFTPKKGKIREFDEVEFRAFCADPHLFDKPLSKNKSAFFPVVADKNPNQDKQEVLENQPKEQPESEADDNAVHPLLPQRS